MGEPILCRRRCRTLQTQVIRCEGRDWLILGCLGRLWHDGGIVKDHTQAVLVVTDRISHPVHGPRAQEELEMFYMEAVRGREHKAEGLLSNLPQPNTGTPG
jgi:hypothetical protein